MKKYSLRLLTVAVMAIAFVTLLSAPVFAAASWKQIESRFSAVAGETLATGNVVSISASDGKAYKADANDSSLRPAVGVIGKGGASGAKVEVVISGIIAGMTAQSPGVRLYLSETAGSVTSTAPTNPQVLGWVMPGTAGAVTSTTYFINVQMPQSEGPGY